MPSIITPALWRNQPQSAIRVNPSHPLGALFSHVFVPGLDGRDGARDRLGSAFVPYGSGSAAPGVDTRRIGRVLTLNGSQNAYHTAASIQGSSTFPIVMVAAGYFGATSSNYPLIGMGRSGSGGGEGKQIRLASSTAVDYLTRENFGSTAQPSVTTGTVTGQFICAISQSLSATDHRIYVNGLTSTSSTNTGNPAGTYNKIGLGASWANGSGSPSVLLNGGLVFGAVGFRPIPDSVALELSVKPELLWEIFQPTPRRIFVSVSGSGSTGTVAVTNANDTVSATGTTTVIGTLARTNANDSASASGTTTIIGALATTNANDTCSASGDVGGSISGSVAYTNANDSAAGFGTTTVVGTAAPISANDTLAAGGTTTIVGAIATTNADDTISATGVAGTIAGSANIVNNNDIATAYGESQGSVFQVYGLKAYFRREESEEQKRIRREAQGIIKRVTTTTVHVDKPKDQEADISAEIKAAIIDLETAVRRYAKERKEKESRNAARDAQKLRDLLAAEAVQMELQRKNEAELIDVMDVLHVVLELI